MAKVQKFYAVRKGSVPGIYLSWDECKQSVDGFPGAEYKSFSSEEEAQAYMNGGVKFIIPEITDRDTAVAYTDGSFNAETNRPGYGAIIITQDKEYIISGIAKMNNAYHVTLRQITGEVVAVLKVLDFCKEHGIKKISICYDYAGLEYWANGTWKANNPVSQEYQQILQKQEFSFLADLLHKENLIVHLVIQQFQHLDQLYKKDSFLRQQEQL